MRERLLYMYSDITVYNLRKIEQGLALFCRNPRLIGIFVECSMTTVTEYIDHF